MLSAIYPTSLILTTPQKWCNIIWCCMFFLFSLLILNQFMYINMFLLKPTYHLPVKHQRSRCAGGGCLWQVLGLLDASGSTSGKPGWEKLPYEFLRLIRLGAICLSVFVRCTLSTGEMRNVWWGRWWKMVLHHGFRGLPTRLQYTWNCKSRPTHSWYCMPTQVW